MKNIIILLLLPLFFKAQIEVKEPVKKRLIGQHKVMGVLWSEIEESIIKEDTIYTLSFKNRKYTQISDYQTLIIKNKQSLTDLYNIMSVCFDDEKRKDYTVSFKLWNDDVTVSSYKEMGVKEAMVQISAGYFTVNENQFKKLFGKK